MVLLLLSTVVFAQTYSISKMIKTGEFNGIYIKGINLSVRVIQDTNNSFQLIGDDTENVTYSIEDGILEIEAKPMENNIQLVIYSSKLNYLRLSDVVFLSCDSFSTDSLVLRSGGATKITFNQLHANKVFTDIDGAARLILSGTAEYHQLRIDGAGDVDARKFYTRETNLDISGAGKASIFAIEKITGKISGAAQLEITGSPTVNDIEVSGAATFKGKSISKGKGDTVTVKIGKYEFKILEDKEMVIKDKQTEKANDKEKKYQDGSAFTPWSGLDFGVTGYLNSDNSITLPNNYDFLSLDYKNSIRVGINFVEKNLKIIDDYLLFGSGIGFDINNYRFSRNTRLVGNQNVLTGYVDTLVNYQKTKLRLIYLNVPLLIEVNTSSKEEHAFHLAFGPVFGYNIGSKTKLVYSVNGQKNKDKARGDFNTNPFRYGITARMGYGENLMIFATYDLSALFIDGQGPQIYPFAIGLSFVDF